MRRALFIIPLLPLFIGSAAFADQADGTDESRPSEVRPITEPEGQPWASAGEIDRRIARDTETTVPIVVYNSGSTPLAGVTVSLTEANSPVRFVRGTANIGDVAGGGEGRGTISIVVESSKDCSEELVLDGSIAWTGGTAETSIGLSVLCPGPRLYQSSVRYTGGDEDGVPERGERLSVWVTYGNNGADPATNISGRLAIATEGVTVITGEASWPNIPAGGASESLTPFVVEFSNDAPLDAGCSWDGGTSDPVMIDGGDATTSSDGTDTPAPPPVEDSGAGTSSDGNPGSEPGSPPESGQVDPEEPATEPDRASDQPIEPHKGTPPEPSVAFEGSLTITTAETKVDDFLGSMMMCAMMESAGGLPPTAGADDSSKELALTPTGARGAGGGATPLAALLAIFAIASLYFARKTMHARLD